MALTVEGIVLYSEDLDRARAFYRDVLGLPLLLDEGHVIHFDAGTVRLAIHRCPPGQRREAPEGFLVFGVEDLAIVHEELRKRGAEFLGPPATRPYGRVAYLHDPEGHEIGLLEEPRKGTEGHRRVAPLVARYEQVIGKLGHASGDSQGL
jgi:predicted enzyme related to lactoylglutathione lyase